MNSVVAVEAALQTIVTGVMIGVIYGLMATGVGVIFGVMRVANFAQGEFLMLAMYGAGFITTLTIPLVPLGVTFNAYLGAVLIAPIVFVFGAAIHRFLLSRITGMRAINVEGEGHFAQMILTLGISLIIQSVALASFGATPRQNHTPISDQAWSIQPFSPLDIMIFVNKGLGVSSLVAAILVFLLFLFFSRTAVGKALRAAADNPVAATYVGIKVGKTHRFAFAFGASITACAGGLVAVYYPFQPYVGEQFLVIMYAAVVLGGLGSVLGAFWGGLIIGLVQQISAIFLPIELQSAAIFVVFVLTLFVKPEGIFGKNVERV